MTTFIVDIDGTLCEEVLTPAGMKPDYASATPRLDVIEKVRRKFFSPETRVILFTSRFEADREETVEWLARYGVRYHDIIFDKPKGDFYVDESAFYPSDLDKIRHVEPKVAVAFSGGLDSLATYFRILDNPVYKEENIHLVYVGSSEYSQQEIEAASALANKLNKSLNILPNHSFHSRGKIEVPFRNLEIVTAIARELPEVSLIYLGALKDDNCRDKTREALDAMTHVLRTNGHNPDITVRSCFLYHDKKEVVGYLLKHPSVDLTMLRKCWSCYYSVVVQGEFVPCGDCPACFRKWVALEANNIQCAHWFHTKPYNSDTACQYRIRISNGLNSSRMAASRFEYTRGVLERYHLL